MRHAALVAIGALVIVGRTGAAEPSPHPNPAATFKAHCAHCHGEDGRSDTLDARALKVEPLAGDARLARMTPAEIVIAVKSNDKHRAVVTLDDADLEWAARYVVELAKKTR
jgi:mono/diheme cytochrome c family protein